MTDYREAAAWWQAQAVTSAVPERYLEYAANLLRLADDMEMQPAYYRIKPNWFTDWQWMNKRENKKPENSC